MNTPGEKLVIGIDSSTQSTKAIAWNRAGHAVAEGRAPIPLLNPSLDYFEQNPADWWSACRDSLRALFRRVDPEHVEALAISNQRETIAFLDENGAAVRPAMVWLDERARPQIDELCAILGAENIHRITGRPPDVTPVAYRLLWMKTHRPAEYARTARFADVQCFLVHRLCGGWKTGWISADPTGLYDLEGKRWSPEILDALGLSTDRLPEALPPGAPLGQVTGAAAAQTGLRAGTPVFAAGGDGQLAGLGTDCTRADRAYVNLGTAVVSGVWSPDYCLGDAWRTELAAQGEGYILENCLRTGAFLVNWFVERFTAEGRQDSNVFDKLERAAAEIPIGCDGLMTQPYWSGVMDPHWDAGARGCITGFRGAHTPAHVYRSLIEGMTLDQVMRTARLEAQAGLEIKEYLAIGGGAASPLWRQMLADASGKQVLVSDTLEASALGAGMIAATGAGWYATITEAAHAMAGTTSPIDPHPAHGARYRALLDIYADLYGATAGINRRLDAFAAKAPAP